MSILISPWQPSVHTRLLHTDGPWSFPPLQVHLNLVATLTWSHGPILSRDKATVSATDLLAHRDLLDGYFDELDLVAMTPLSYFQCQTGVVLIRIHQKVKEKVVLTL